MVTSSAACDRVVPVPHSALHRWWLATVGGLPATFWWLWTGTLVNRAGAFVQPFLVLYLTGPRELTVTQAGAVLAGYGAGAFVSQPLGGVLTDRVGRRVTLVGGLAATGVMLGGLGAARGFVAILVVAFALGVVTDLFRPAATAIVADLFDDEARPRAFALQFWAVNLGFSLAGIVGGVLATHGYTLLFVVDALTCVVFAVVVGLKVPETRPERDRDQAPAPRFEGARAIARDRLLLAAIALIFVYAVVYIQAYTVLPLHTRDIGLGTTAYGVAIAVNGIAIVALQPLLLPVFGRVPVRILMPASLTLVGAGLAATGLADSLPLLMATVAVWSVGEIGFSVIIQTLVTGLAPLHLRGRYIGATGLAWGGSVLFGPVVGTAVYGAAPAALWWGCLTLAVLAAALSPLLDRAVVRRREAAAVRV